MTVWDAGDMTESPVETLTSRQVADLRRQLRERDARGLATSLQQLPAPALPGCPACDAEVERIDQRVEDPEFGVYETWVRMRWLPCGHRFRAAVDMDAPPVDEYRLSSRPRVVGGGS